MYISVKAVIVLFVIGAYGLGFFVGYVVRQIHED